MINNVFVDECEINKTKYYTQNIQRLAKWSKNMTKDNIADCIDMLGLAQQYKDKIIYIVTNKFLGKEIAKALTYLADFPEHEKRIDCLTMLKIILPLCTKAQAITIYNCIANTADDIRADLDTLSNF